MLNLVYLSTLFDRDTRKWLLILVINNSASNVICICLNARKCHRQQYNCSFHKCLMLF